MQGNVTLFNQQPPTSAATVEPFTLSHEIVTAEKFKLLDKLKYYDKMYHIRNIFRTISRRYPLCAKEKKDKQYDKDKTNIECMQNNVRSSVVREYAYLRKLKGLTQAEVAKRAGISRTNVSRFESGEYNPSLEMLVKLAAAMDLDVSVTFRASQGREN